MTSKEFIQTKLTNRTNAAASDVEAKNNRWHYRLVFDENIGWDWLEKQVEKASAEVEETLEPYKFGPVEDVSAVVVEVRELERREGIDESQHSLDAFDGA